MHIETKTTDVSDPEQFSKYICLFRIPLIIER